MVMVTTRMMTILPYPMSLPHFRPFSLLTWIFVATLFNHASLLNINPMCPSHNASDSSPASYPRPSILPVGCACWSGVNYPLCLWWSPRHLSGDSAYRSMPPWSPSPPFRQNWCLTMLINIDLIHCTFSLISLPPLLDPELLEVMNWVFNSCCSIQHLACCAQLVETSSKWLSECRWFYLWWEGIGKMPHSLGSPPHLASIWDLLLSQLTCGDFAWLSPVRYVLWDQSCKL